MVVFEHVRYELAVIAQAALSVSSDLVKSS